MSVHCDSCVRFSELVGELRERLGVVQAERDAALATIAADREAERELRHDAMNVLTVYDDNTAPENRGPWRDRLMEWADAPVKEPDEHSAMLRLGYTGVHGWYRCEHCGHNQEIDTRPKASA
jgi:hypothetical protein